MKIATWNIEGPGMSPQRAHEILAQMAAVDADVWIITEAHPEVDPGPAFRLIAESVQGHDRGGGERWIAIWVRSAFDAQELPAFRSERTAAVRLSGPADLVVYGTVLPWNNDDRYGPRGLEAFAAALNFQRIDWEQLRKAEPAVPLVVAGDFNQDLLREGHYYGSKDKKALLRRALARNRLRCATRDLWVDGHACIDHICLSRGIRATDAKPETWPAKRDTSLSDHFGLALTVEFASRPDGPRCPSPSSPTL